MNTKLARTLYSSPLWLAPFLFTSVAALPKGGGGRGGSGGYRGGGGTYISSSDDDDDDKRIRLSTPVIVVIVLCALLVVGVIAFSVFRYRRRINMGPPEPYRSRKAQISQVQPYTGFQQSQSYQPVQQFEPVYQGQRYQAAPPPYDAAAQTQGSKQPGQ